MTTAVAPVVLTYMRCGPIRPAHARLLPVPAGAVLEVDAGRGVTWILTPAGEHVRCAMGGCTRDGLRARAMRTVEVRATLTAGACDVRCMGADGLTCRCSCGGRNHGSLA